MRKTRWALFKIQQAHFRAKHQFLFAGFSAGVFLLRIGMDFAKQLRARLVRETKKSETNTQTDVERARWEQLKTRLGEQP